jgi:hypothetical protein
VRAKHMTLDPAGNRYIKYIRNIRAIQVPMRSAACTCTRVLYQREHQGLTIPDLARPLGTPQGIMFPSERACSAVGSLLSGCQLVCCRTTW